MSKEKQFAFLGVYSGELYKPRSPIEVSLALTINLRDTVNQHVVWYGNLVEEIVAKGKPMKLDPKVKTSCQE